MAKSTVRLLLTSLLLHEVTTAFSPSRSNPSITSGWNVPRHLPQHCTQLCRSFDATSPLPFSTKTQLPMARSSEVIKGMASLGRNRDENLVAWAKELLNTKSGFYGPVDEEVYDDDFVFRGPYIGPLNKKDYLETLETFGVYKAIPDISANAWGFSIDPQDPYRVWFMVRNTGTFTGEPGLGLGKEVYFPPNGAKLEGCPETFSMKFTRDFKLKYLSVGYVADRFEGNTKGKGAAFGIFNAVGLPVPSPGPLLQLAQWLGTEIVQNGPKAYSTEGIPEWWKDEQKACDGYI